jgi:hypothetical protein
MGGLLRGRFWSATIVGALAGGVLWVIGFVAVSRVYSPLGLAFLVLVGMVYYLVGAKVAIPPAVGRSAAAGAVAGAGAGTIAATWLYMPEPEVQLTWAAWASSLVFGVLSQGVMGAVCGLVAAWRARRRLPANR